MQPIAWWADPETQTHLNVEVGIVLSKATGEPWFAPGEAGDDPEAELAAKEEAVLERVDAWREVEDRENAERRDREAVEAQLQRARDVAERRRWRQQAELEGLTEDEMDPAWLDDSDEDDSADSVVSNESERETPRWRWPRKPAASDSESC